MHFLSSLPSRERGLKYSFCLGMEYSSIVAPFAGAWIEIVCMFSHHLRQPSLPSRERGLKYRWFILRTQTRLSLPSRERGLKYTPVWITPQHNYVAPFAGAWIEIPFCDNVASGLSVAPFAGAWIEILPWCPFLKWNLSLPSRERGLKSGIF